MRLYGAIQKVEPQDDGTVRVHGIASSEVVDDQGEIVRADAMRAAIPDYMHFPALREMHQLSAAGTTLEAEVGDDGATRIVAHVVDPIAITKVRNQVYRGFSIGGRVTQREPGNPKAITGIVLNEISLVDRPANPEAVFDCWKASAASDMQVTPSRRPFNPPIQIWACGVPDHHHRAKGEAVKCLEKTALGDAGFRLSPSGPAALEPPSAGRGETESADATEAAIDAAKRAIETAEGALAKTDARRKMNAPASSLGDRNPADYADPGYQSDGKLRYPIDTERHIRAAWSYINRPGNARRYTADQVKRIKAAIIAAWKEKIDPEGPPSAADGEKASRAALTKALWDVGHIARIILELDWLQDVLEVEAAMEPDESLQPGPLRAIVTELCGLLNALLSEETDEILNDTQLDDGSALLNASELLAMAAGVRGAARIAALLKTGKPNMQKLAADLVAEAKHSQGDQALVDMARYACDKCLQIDGLSAEQMSHMSKARDHLCEAGATPSEVSTVDTAHNIEEVVPQIDPPASDFRPGDNATVDRSKGLDGGAAPHGQRGSAHQNLMDIAHECVSKLTGGMACSRPLPNSEPEPSSEGNAKTQDIAREGARHSGETMGHLRAAHDHLVAAGAICEAPGVGEEEHQGTEFDTVKAVRSEDFAKVLADERAEKATLVKTLGEMVPLLDRLSKRVDDIARTPLPPLTIARGSLSVSKEQDSGSTGLTGDNQLSPEAIASALAKMSKEEQTLTLIKASYANPIRVLGVTAGER
ncbi:MAG: hypothetical protein JO282_14420 [Alphaproteobacteria bacterium]|nr:hypothetical protein [Alphaproteobacteria bacterium]